MRSQTEIRELFDWYSSNISGDPFGFRREALLEAMEFDTARDLLKPEVTREDWKPPEMGITAREYLKFAIGKAVDHRGLSAGRSIEKLEEWTWCLGDDDLYRRFQVASYYPYGAPQLRILAEEWDVGWDDDDETWQRMSRGLPCEQGCMQGCRG